MTNAPIPVPLAKPAAQKTKSGRTRDAILSAARNLFADQGYDRTTVRDIAARAGFDPALVIRYFGGKEALFARATEFDLRTPDLAVGDPADLGRNLVAHFLRVWEGPDSNGSLPILLRTAAANESAAARMRDIFAAQVLPLLAQVSRPEETALRAGLISSHLLGLALCRYVLMLPPVAAMPVARIVENVGPTLQTYLTGPVK